MEFTFVLSDRQGAILLKALENPAHSVERFVMAGIEAVAGRYGIDREFYLIMQEDFSRDAMTSITVADFKRYINSHGKTYTQYAICKYMRLLKVKQSRPVINGKQVRAWNGIKLRSERI